MPHLNPSAQAEGFFLSEKNMNSPEHTGIQLGTSVPLQKTTAGSERSSVWGMLMPVFIVVLVLLIDQTVKIWIKMHMTLGDQVPVIENLFYIHFTENYGMAFGLQLEGSYGKLLLSLFRILAVGGIGWYLYSLLKQKAHNGLIFSISLIMAGAIGNILDSAFYGLIFSESSPMDVATFLPQEGGYAGFLHGAVVDMFYFNSHFEHVFWSSEPFNFSFPIFNISDSAITFGVIIILIFQRKFFKNESEESAEATIIAEGKVEDKGSVSENNPA
jgi:signal peptidase II